MLIAFFLVEDLLKKVISLFILSILTIGHTHASFVNEYSASFDGNRKFGKLDSRVEILDLLISKGYPFHDV